MQNLPNDLKLPTVAISPERALVIRAKATDTRPPFEGRVLAVGWYADAQKVDGMSAEHVLVYLVLDRLAEEKTPFWVRSDFVESATESA